MDAGESGRESVRVGIVSSTNPEKNTCRVTFPDKDDLVSSELRILHRGSVGNKDFWMPDVDDEVVCLFPTNDESYYDGFIVGTLFNEKVPPNANSQDIVRIDFKDGTRVEYDRENHAMNISCKGTLTITCDKEISISSQKDISITSQKDISVTSKKNISIKADKEIEIKSKGGIKMKGKQINLNDDDDEDEESGE